MTCVFYGDPVPTVGWYFQGEQQFQPVPINTGNGTEILVGPDEGGVGSGGSGNQDGDLLVNPFVTSTLSIAQLGVEDGGLYVCNATNGVLNFIGSITSHNSTVKVQGEL